MLSMLLQCYSFCDTLLVGRFLGTVALTATGSAAATWIPTMLLMVVGYKSILRRPGNPS